MRWAPPAVASEPHPDAPGHAHVSISLHRTAPATTRTFPLGLDVEVVPGRGHEPLLVARGLAELLERLLRARPILDDTRQDGCVTARETIDTPSL